MEHETDAQSTHRHQDLPVESIDLPLYLAFLKLDGADAERLRALLPLFAAAGKTFVDRFYDHLLSFEQTARFLRDPDQVEHLKQLQRAHWESTLASAWDEEFVDRRMAVGRAHAMRGVQPLLYLGSNYQFVEFLVRGVMEQQSSGDVEKTEQILAVLKAVFLEASLSLESYFAKMTQDLRQALDMVWKANDRLRQFARLTSHDMKTPLATVANLCEEVLDEFGGEIPEEARDMVHRAQQTVYRMSATIDELLSDTMATGDEEVDEEVDCQLVVHEAIGRLQPQLTEKGIDVNVAEGIPAVLGSKLQIREAFYNLLSNAEKYIDKKPGRIEITVEARGSECVLSFADNGPGIPPGELDQVFTAFRRLTRHQDRPGSGLGLYFAKRLIEHQGGRIWAESKPGQGTCFHVALKRAAAR